MDGDEGGVMGWVYDYGYDYDYLCLSEGWICLFLCLFISICVDGGEV